MESNPSSITFSITGILSSGNSSKNNHPTRNRQTPSPNTPDSKYRFHGFVPNVYNDVRYKESNDHLISNSVSDIRNAFPVTPPHIQIGTPHRIPSLHTDVPFYGSSEETTPSHAEFYRTQPRLSFSPQTDHPTTTTIHDEIQTPQNGRFRPPPFFDTVLVLRKRLYYLGGKVYPTDEPPRDRNVHKLWRSVEKHKVNYSLQHYFYVASLSNRCFDLVEGIYLKVSRGLLEGSREKEVNQSYFNFLYGKTEDERYRLLYLLERGEVSPKDVLKGKQNGGVSKKQTTTNNHSKWNPCRNCRETIDQLKEEKRQLQQDYDILKTKYEAQQLKRQHGASQSNECQETKKFKWK